MKKVAENSAKEIREKIVEDEASKEDTKTLDFGRSYKACLCRN